MGETWTETKVAISECTRVSKLKLKINYRILDSVTALRLRVLSQLVSRFLGQLLGNTFALLRANDDRYRDTETDIANFDP